MTGSGVMKPFFFLRIRPEIWKSRNLSFAHIWRLGEVRETKFDTIISNKMLLNAANGRVTAFDISELLRENQQKG